MRLARMLGRVQVTAHEIMQDTAPGSPGADPRTAGDRYRRQRLPMTTIDPTVP